MEENGKIYYGTGIDNSQLKIDADESKRILRGIGNEAEKVGEQADASISKANDSLSKLSGMVGVAFGMAGVKQFVSKVFEVRSYFQDINSTMEVFLGSQEKAAEFTKQLKDYAYYNMFEFADLADASKQLIAYGNDINKVIPIIDKLSNIATATKAPLKELITLYNKAKSTGKVDTALLDSWAAKGVVIKDTLKEMGVTAVGTSVSFDQLNMVLDHLTGEGGRFHDLMLNQMDNLSASMWQLEDNLASMWNEIGEKMQEPMKKGLDLASYLVENYEAVGEVLKELVIAYGTYKAALIVCNSLQAVNVAITAAQAAGVAKLTAAEVIHYGWLVAQEKAQKLLNLAILKNPYVLAAAAIAGLVVGMYKYIHVVDKTNEALKDHNSIMEEMDNAYEQEGARIQQLIGKLQDETTSRIEQIEAIDELKKMFPGLFEKYIDEKGHITDIIELQKELNKQRSLNRHKEESDLLDEYERKLKDFKLLQDANNNGVDWARAGTTENVATLTKDRPIWKSNKAYVDEQVSYWTAMVNEQRRIVSKNKEEEWEARLKEATDDELERLRSQYDNFEEKYGFAMSEFDAKQLAQIEAEIASRGKQTETRNKAYWENFKKQKEAELAELTDAELTSEKAVEIRKQIAEAEKKIAAYSVSYKEGAKTADDTAERKAKIEDYVRARTKEEQDAEFEIRQAAINAQRDGFDKQIKQAQLDYDRLIAANEERKRQMVESMRDEKLNEWMISHPKATKEQQLVFRATISENDLTEEQKAIIKQYEVMAAEMQQKANKEALEGMLLEYGDYAEQKKAIDNQYLSDLSFATVAFFNATTEDEKERYANLIKDIGKNKAKAILDLSLASIDSTVYDTIEEKMQAINSAYQEYIKNLEDAGASEAEINAATAEQVELTGTLTTLNAKLADIEARIRNLQQGGTDKEGKTLSDLLKMKAEVESELKSAESKSFKELWDAQKNTLVANSIDQVTNALYRLAEASGSLNAEQAADFMSSLSKGVQGFQSGAFIGLLIAGIEDTIAQITDAVVAVEAIESAVNDAKLDKWKADMESLMEQGNGSIFGTDSLANVNGMVSVLEEARKKMEDLNGEAQEFDYWDFNRVLEWTNALSWRNWADIFGAETRNNVNTYFDAINKGYTELEAHVFRTNNHGWLLNFFGVDDEYTSFKDLTEKLGYEMYDEFGNLNKDALEAILKAYGDQLSDEDKEWLEKAIAYCDEYKSAMEGIAEYLSSLFGQVADTIADNFINSFLESGEAAAKFGNVVSDVAKSMVKDLIKSKILAALDPFSQQLQDIMAGDGTQDEKIAAMMAVFASMQEAMDALTPEMQAILESYQQFFEMGDSEREPSSRGIAQASQDSVDELNGRMTAVQGHTYSISENTILIQQNTANIMQSVMNIERDVNDMDNRIYSMETMTTQMRNTLDDFRQNGIRIR